jgi:hypothetical protein
VLAQDLLGRIERKVAEAQAARWEHSQPLAIRLDPPPEIADDAVIAGLVFSVQSKAGAWVEVHREPAAKLASEAEVDDLLARGLSVFLMKHPSWPK